MFVQHVHLLHTERDMGFLAEYQNLQQSASLTGKYELEFANFANIENFNLFKAVAIALSFISIKLKCQIICSIYLVLKENSLDIFHKISNGKLATADIHFTSIYYIFNYL